MSDDSSRGDVPPRVIKIVDPDRIEHFQDCLQTALEDEEADPTDHFESFYHCLHCRQVFYWEETDDKITKRCPNCGPGSQFKITEASDAF